MESLELKKILNQSLIMQPNAWLPQWMKPKACLMESLVLKMKLNQSWEMGDDGEFNILEED